MLTALLVLTEAPVLVHVVQVGTALVSRVNRVIFRYAR